MWCILFVVVEVLLFNSTVSTSVVCCMREEGVVQRNVQFLREKTPRVWAIDRGRVDRRDAWAYSRHNQYTGVCIQFEYCSPYF